MLDKMGIDRFGPPGFTVSQKEKDYVQHWILSFLSRTGTGGAFKGGTALQKAYSLPRYSEDLDFTLGSSPAPDLPALAAFISSAGFSGVSSKEIPSADALRVKMRARGPLFNGKALSEVSVTLDFSTRETPVLKPVPAAIAPPYPDLLPYSVLVLDRREIAAEKVRTLFMRESARDLFDLFFLARGGFVPDSALIGAKLGPHGIAFSPEAFGKRLDLLKRIWKAELDAFTPNPVDYEEARAAVEEAVCGAGR